MLWMSFCVDGNSPSFPFLLFLFLEKKRKRKAEKKEPKKRIKDKDKKEIYHLYLIISYPSINPPAVGRLISYPTKIRAKRKGVGAWAFYPSMSRKQLSILMQGQTAVVYTEIRQL